MRGRPTPPRIANHGTTPHVRAGGRHLRLAVREPRRHSRPTHQEAHCQRRLEGKATITTYPIDDHRTDKGLDASALPVVVFLRKLCHSSEWDPAEIWSRYMTKVAVLLSVALGGLALMAYALFTLNAPSTIEPKGDSDTLIPYVALATSIVSLLTGLIGALKAYLEVKKLRLEKK